MPTIDEAIERACAAYAAHVGETVFDDGMRAALSAFLAVVPVSEGMVEAGVDCIRHFDLEPHLAEYIHKTMCAKLAEEI